MDFWRRDENPFIVQKICLHPFLGSWFSVGRSFVIDHPIESSWPNPAVHPGLYFLACFLPDRWLRYFLLLDFEILHSLSVSMFSLLSWCDLTWWNTNGVLKLLITRRRFSCSGVSATPFLMVCRFERLSVNTPIPWSEVLIGFRRPSDIAIASAE